MRSPGHRLIPAIVVGCTILLQARVASAAEFSSALHAWASHLTSDPVLRLAGRLHVIAIHFPIALVLVAAMVELVAIFRRPRSPSRAATPLLALGVLGAIVAAGLGWIHARHASPGATLENHRWLGVAAAGAGLVVLLLRILATRSVAALWLYRLGIVGCAAAILIAGYTGGTLTHGTGYLALERRAPGTPAAAQPHPTTAPASAEETFFVQKVQPLLAASCYECHGPTARKGGLRLDQPAAALKGGQAGPSILPGDSEKSPLVRRVLGLDKQTRMPKGAPPLTEEQVAILRTWIDRGATWPGAGATTQPAAEPKHWAYELPARPLVPQVKNPAWVRNPIDAFILARLEREGVQPSPTADRPTLIRRLSLDLVGLPPSIEEAEAFVTDTSPDACEKLVERLLQSPHHGERLAVYWLDLVRYADTIGYHSDLPREVWLYRDWVIAAFNANMRFDEFTIEQLAGDLVPRAGVSQKIASGYNRLLQTTVEGGAQPAEYIVKYASDRVRNASSAWLGATIGCAECHDHKYDPYTARDFYRFAAFFADVNDPTPGGGGGAVAADFPVPTQEQAQRLAHLDGRIAAMKRVLEANKDDPDAKAALARAEADRNGLLAAIPQTLATTAVDPRPVRLLARGNWLDTSGEIVTPAIPAFLKQIEAPGRRANRMDLARWIVSRDNPLTARVFVNRLWKLFYGTGLSRTVDDFGAQGENPVDPLLLDWLAVEFMESGWDIRHMIRLMVTSNAYRQASAASPSLRDRDPDNRLYARQSPMRLDAEFVRDNALAIAGQLSLRIGGPSVKPYQPAGYWDYLNFPRRTYQNDHGESLYRRGLYAWWQRSFLNPSLLAFDAPTREECTADRPRSNIPQQALVLLNDPTYVEASRLFAERILRQGGSTPDQRLTWAFRSATARAPSAKESAVLHDLLDRHRKEYAADAAAAGRIIAAGEAPVAKDLDPVELAAWTSVARTILNLHETITRY